jgi:hypothetical protein
MPGIIAQAGHFRMREKDIDLSLRVAGIGLKSVADRKAAEVFGQRRSVTLHRQHVTDPCVRHKEVSLLPSIVGLRLRQTPGSHQTSSVFGECTGGIALCGYHVANLGVRHR